MTEQEKLKKEYEGLAKFLGWIYIPFDDYHQEHVGWYSEDPRLITARKGVQKNGKHISFVARHTLALDFRYNYDRLMQVFEGLSKKYGLTLSFTKEGLWINDGEDDIFFEGNDTKECLYDACLSFLKLIRKTEKKKK